MLPDLRAVLAATIATVGLLIIAFGAVAALRVAQGSHGALQADLAKGARMVALPPPPGRRVTVIDTPGPHIAPFPPLPITEVKDAPIASELRDVPVAAAPAATVAALPAPEPAAASIPATPPAVAAVAVGGPLAVPKTLTDAQRAAAKAERARKIAAAKKARAARLAHQRKLAAARRAARARARQAQSTPAFNNTFNNSGFGGDLGRQQSQGAARQNQPWGPQQQ